MKTLPTTTDVAVIGAGPVGCVTAIAFARKGASVLLLEAHPQGTKRLAGEWLHPPGVEVLKRLGVGFNPEALGYPNGKGFVVFPDDGTQPIQLNYPEGALGLSCEHGQIVSTLREAAASHAGVHFIPGAKVTHIEGQCVSFENGKHEETKTILAERIVGADGRSSIARRQLDFPGNRLLVSYMAGVLVENVELPFEGLGHVLLGEPGLGLIYRIGQHQVRICLDVPIDSFQKKATYLWDAYSPIIPEALLPAFRYALQNRSIAWVANQFCYHTHYGREGLILVGDAAGYCHPLTATGMTIGFQDGECLARSQSFKDYQHERKFGTFVPEVLATTLYEVFAGNDDSAIALRKAVYRLWRQDPAECRRTMHLLSGAEINVLSFCQSFFKVVFMAVEQVIKDTASQRQWSRMLPVLGSFVKWLQWPFAIALSRLIRPSIPAKPQLKS